jgi:hypothetical protein
LLPAEGITDNLIQIRVTRVPIKQEPGLRRISDQSRWITKTSRSALNEYRPTTNAFDAMNNLTYRVAGTSTEVEVSAAASSD